MSGSYALFENNTVVIGNDYIERRFSTENNKLVTTEIINKWVDGSKTLNFKKFSAEFFVAFKRKKFLGYATDFLSSNDLTLDNVNVFKRRVEFIFKPYAYNGARITFIVNVEIEDDKHYMHKYIEMMVDSDRQHLVTIDYIDCEHICIDNLEQMWTIGDVDKAHISGFHASLGQPFYMNGLFFGSEFPVTETKIRDKVGFIRYYTGKRFDQLNLNCGHTFRTWKTVVGAARSLEHRVVREDFLTYIRDISRKVQPRFQYNSWYDHMHDITDENISKSFMEIEKGLTNTLVPPLDSYVVDDGFVDWDASFWAFNKKFPNELYPASTLARKFSSEFGLWNGPRGGYNDKTGNFGKNMEKAGKGGYNKVANDVCVSSFDYIKNITDYYLDYTKKFDINYWKLDGFLLTACKNKKHGHMVGGHNGMYQYTEMWENWINIFKKIRLSRETIGKDMWINQTSYSIPSPWFLQWSDSLWIQNSEDIGFIDKTKKGEKLGYKDVDRTLTYRDNCYYDFSVVRDYQFPNEFLYNHDPIYGNTAKISMTDEEYRTYMFMMATRGTAFWELYYSYNMFNTAKWRINADALRFIRNEYEVLKTSQFVGGCPAKGEVYGYSAWTENKGIVSLRNPANCNQSFKFKLDESFGTFKGTENLKCAFVYPYDHQKDEKTYNYGDELSFELAPHEVVIMKFSNVKENVPSLIYGRFNNDKELLLFFNDRIYLNDEMISSNAKIAETELLEDYSTLKVTFENPVKKPYVSLTVQNAFGDYTDITFKGKYYPNFICDDNKLPSDRDFTVNCTVNKAEDGTLLSFGDFFNVNSHSGYAVIRLGDKISHSEAFLSVGDKLSIVCEPNGLLKLYVNSKLACSAYSKEPLTLENTEVVLSENVTDLELKSKAFSYDEI